MFDLFGMESEGQRKRRKEREREDRERRLPLCVPWDPKIKFQKELNIKADTYPYWNLFPDVTPCREVFPQQVLAKGPAYYRMSEDETFFYCVKEIRKGEDLATYYGRQKGSVMFDGSVYFPTLYRKQWEDRWKEEPWMSTTPMEVLTMRGGTKLAKGHTVVAGLGLGFQLAEVTHRKKVTKVTLVEIDQGLVNLMMPALKDRLGTTPVEVIVGDAEKVVPTLTADVALIDIFDGYGGNEFKPCPNIPKVWCWGSQYVQGSNSLWG